MQVSVIIPTHNPRPDHLALALAGLRAQTMPIDRWELIVVDNASSRPLAPQLDLGWHPHGMVIVEPSLGLTAARLAGFAAARGEMLVLVDDDNMLAPDYLAQAFALATEHPRLGTWSGNVTLVFEPGVEPPPPEWRSYLTERIVKTDSISSERDHHDSTPWGAGLCVRREVCDAYTAELARNPLRRQLDLHGQTLLYGGDTDIAYVGCASGFTKGVFARLSLLHLIPARRCQPDFLLRSIEGHAYSSVLHGYILQQCVAPEVTDRLWLAKSWLRGLFLPRTARLEAASRARGHARAVRAIRDMQTSI